MAGDFLGGADHDGCAPAVCARMHGLHLDCHPIRRARAGVSVRQSLRRLPRPHPDADSPAVAQERQIAAQSRLGRFETMLRHRNALARNWFNNIDPAALARRTDGLPTVWRATVKGIPFFIAKRDAGGESWISQAQVLNVESQARVEEETRGRGLSRGPAVPAARLPGARGTAAAAGICQR